MRGLCVERHRPSFQFHGNVPISASQSYRPPPPSCFSFRYRLIARGWRDRVAKGYIIRGLTMLPLKCRELSWVRRLRMFFSIVSLCRARIGDREFVGPDAEADSRAPGGTRRRVAGVAASAPGIAAPLLTGWLKQSTGGYTAAFAVCAPSCYRCVGVRFPGKGEILNPGHGRIRPQREYRKGLVPSLSYSGFSGSSRIVSCSHSSSL